MGTILKSTTGNHFLIGNTRTPKNDVRAKFSGNYVTLESMDGKVLLRKSLYSNLLNGDDSDTAFASIAAVKTWVDANVFAVEIVKSVSVELTRPADTDAYTAKDAISNSTTVPAALIFTGVVNNIGESGRIVKALLQTDQVTNTTVFRLHLFNATPTLTNDNAAQSVTYANKALYVGHMDITLLANAGSAAGVSATQLYFTTGATANLYGMLESVTGFTPASGQKFNIKLSIES